MTTVICVGRQCRHDNIVIRVDREWRAQSADRSF